MNSHANPLVILAPMAGITDLPFRTVVARFGVDRVVSEMIASADILTKRPGTRAKAELGLDAANTAVQLAGCEARWMAEAARLCEAGGARVIDINMGCPAKKVTRASGFGASGSALMRDPDHALRLIEAVVAAVSVPVTLKTRLGWDHDTLNAAEIARRAENAGVSLIAIHGRTRSQFYKGQADWGAIAAVTQAVSIPVIANGDIRDIETARRALRLSGASGVMIGRAARGCPWLPAQVAAVLGGGRPPETPEAGARAALVAEHYDAMLRFYGRDHGLRVARKHLGWYMEAEAVPADLRRRMLTATEPATVLALLPDVFSAPTDDALCAEVAA
ncbi:MAG: tRNA dihydrouridine synthase DusB [Pseudomonadota bacterium]